MRKILPFILLAQIYIFNSFLPKVTAESDYVVHSCSNATKYSPNSTYGSELRTILKSLTSNSSKSRFHSASNNSHEKIQALYQCQGDISLDNCNGCVSAATEDVLQRCPTEKTAVIWYSDCLVRFSNETILSVASTSPKWLLSNAQNSPDSERILFTNYVRNALNESATAAANRSSKFDAKETKTYYNFSLTSSIYSLVQCSEDLSGADCNVCLQNTFWQFPTCCSSSIGGRVLAPSCYFRYEIYSFYNISGATQPPSPSPLASPSSNSSTSPNPDFVRIPSADSPASDNPKSGKRGLSVVAIIAIVVPTGLLGFVCIACFVFAKCRRQTRVDDGIALMLKDPLIFDLSTLEAATNNFATDNLLARGERGDVFKGTLESGQEIVVKNLSVNSVIDETEFKRQANLVEKLQHRNLTRLLGLCIDGEKRILVYELVPNKSLDLFLFKTEGRQHVLDWHKRFKIIEGVARGILYLHEDSRLKIIHRNLKASNVLLDGYFNPKISDFGMVRIFGSDESGATTNRTFGTLGCMAPEYAIHGKFSAKSDVYSYGVLVLEIITGLKATEMIVTDDGGNLDVTSFVWKHWNEKKVLEVVDKAMGDDYSKEEVMRCIHVALLCLEELPSNRPTMETVVLMLNSYTATVTLPKKPAFNQINNDKVQIHQINCSITESRITDVYPR